jgi:hypothetical protein
MGRKAEESNGKAGRRRAPARVLYARCFATWEPDTLSERITLSAEVIHLGELLGEQELVLDGRRWQIVNGSRRSSSWRRPPPCTGGSARCRRSPVLAMSPRGCCWIAIGQATGSRPMSYSPKQLRPPGSSGCPGCTIRRLPPPNPIHDT